jgi:hypothetical protein
MLITILIVILLLALALYAVRLLPLDAPLSGIVQVLLVIIAIIYIASAAGLGR